MDLVTAYTRRALTYPSDILVALQGFVNELQKLSPLDGFVMGIWWRYADVQLAWVSDEGSQQRTSEGLDIPSWSWASRTRSIRFPFNQHMGNQFDLCNGKRCCSRARIELGKSVIIQSKTKQAYCFVGLFMVISTITASWESSPMRCTTNIRKREIVISITVYVSITRPLYPEVVGFPSPILREILSVGLLWILQEPCLEFLSLKQRKFLP